MHTDPQNPLQSTVFDAGSILGSIAKLCSRPIVVTGTDATHDFHNNMA